MVREINGPTNGSPPVNNSAGKARPAAIASQETGAAAAAGVDRDPVRLSDSAQALQAMEQKLHQLPDVNEQRVAEIKAALASGEYTVDDVVVADKLLAFETLLD